MLSYLQKTSLQGTQKISTFSLHSECALKAAIIDTAEIYIIRRKIQKKNWTVFMERT